MKKYLLLVLLASGVCLTTQAQSEEDVSNFLVEGNNITWQKTFVTILTEAQMAEKVAEMMLFESKDINKSDKIIGTVKPIQHNYIKAGYSEKSAEKYVVEKDSYGALKIEFQEGKYRVTLADIQLKQRFSTRKSQRGENTRLMEFAYDAKKGVWDQNFIQSGSAKILNETFLEKFDVGGKFGGSDF
ncbi:MAG: hypothetical protein ACI8QD_001317 [Cyclobacteriaceae bacterium]|jgi:hypothetical protein